MTTWLQIASASVAIMAARPARADGRFQVDPTLVELSAAARSGAVVVTNHGSAGLRLQASVLAWSDDGGGGMVLSPTTDVVVRPALMDVPPGGSRTIRVGTLAAEGAAEQGFRLFVEELPDRSAARPAGIRVLTRIGVPVFVAPKASRTAVTLAPAVARSSGPAAAAPHGVVVVTNTGTTHVKLATLELRALAGGVARWSHQVNGWYVLPGTTRTFAIDLGHEDCRAGEVLIATATAEGGATWTSAPASCGR